MPLRQSVRAKRPPSHASTSARPKAGKKTGKQTAFRAFFERTALPLMQQQKGLISITGGAARPETPQEFCSVMARRDLEALRAFVGEDRLEAHVHPDEAELVATPQLSHDEVIGA